MEIHDEDHDLVRLGQLVSIRFEPLDESWEFPPWMDSEILPGVWVRFQVKKTRTIGGGVQVTLHPLFNKQPIPENIRCKRCGSPVAVRFGTYKGVQRYRCVECKTTFMGKDTLRYMRVPIPVVADAVSLFYEGLSLNAIRRQLRQTHDIYPSDSNVYYWVVRFTEKAVRAAQGLTARVDSVWVADETVLKIGGENTWFWDIIDAKTRFLLASHISEQRYTRDAKALMDKALERAGKPPKKVITDKLKAYLGGILKAYLGGIEDTFGTDSKHIQSGPFKIEESTSDIEGFHGTLKQRTKVMRGIQNKQTARLILDGWLVHYNFFRPHEGLKDKTPGEVAGIRFPYEGWKDVVRMEAANV